MKKLLALIITVSISVFGFAQDTDKGDKKSREVLDRLTAKTEAYATIKIEFNYKMKILKRILMKILRERYL